ncbi:hypothetical protein H2200_010625 [Cladophialophora chaetospira]|uniref:Uncharacterized protein n=1 Tax=Cladophialophora chaetospira TaxID=386627 RepID=A0AA38X1U0_9EURO|nr:hypothetical protein H2200_010625 [Cladophialophora chaetospira]
MENQLLIQHAFRSLRRVTIPFAETGGLSDGGWVGRWHSVEALASAAELEELNIAGTAMCHLDAQPRPYTTSWLGPIAKLSNSNLRDMAMFPRLRILRLSRVLFTESELINLIVRRERSLEHLELDNITLTRESETSDMPPCFVRLLKAIRTCEIPHVEFSGQLTNLDNQWWEVENRQGQDNQSSTLKGRVQAWASGKGSSSACPLEYAAVPASDWDEWVIPEEDASWRTIMCRKALAKEWFPPLPCYWSEPSLWEM